MILGTRGDKWDQFIGKKNWCTEMGVFIPSVQPKCPPAGAFVLLIFKSPLPLGAGSLPY